MNTIKRQMTNQENTFRTSKPDMVQIATMSKEFWQVKF